MPIPRSELVIRDEPGLYHCVSRCVRRAFLCGDGYEHRRIWIERRLEELASIFAIDVVAYVVMHNHLHTLLWTDPDRAFAWSHREVARRWLALFPKSAAKTDDIDESITIAVRDPAVIKSWRERLADISWFMRCLKEPLARLANREDDCTGAFWEGRFKSYRVCDDAGALTCAVYIDLNVIHAGLARTPEQSNHTSVQARIRMRQAFERHVRTSAGGTDHDPQPAKATAIEPEVGRITAEAGPDAPPRHAEDGLWLTPLGTEAASDGRRSLLGIGVDAYLQLVDAIGRIVRGDKRGSIPARCKPILERLGLDCDSWVAAVTASLRKMIGTTVGVTSQLVREARRRGRRWVRNPFTTIG
jgi:hypothetical protein